MTSSPRSWVVVGAGSAGCVVAARLSERADTTVTLLEAGPDLKPGGVPPPIDGRDAFAAVGVAGRIWPRLAARRRGGGPPLPYLRGRGVGGSSVVNAMLALRGDPAQYLGSHGGGDVTDIEAAWERMALPEREADPAEFGPLDRALVEAAPDTRPVPLTRSSDGHRVSSAEAYLWPAIDRPNLTVRSDAVVDRIVFSGRRAVGVLLADGREISADRVVCSAGAIHSPAILLRSGVDRAGVGEGLQDHPSAALALRYRPGRGPSGPGLVTATILERDGIQIVPVNHLAGADLAHGLVLVALMDPAGRTGSVRLRSDDPADDPVVELDLLADRADLERLRGGVRTALDLVAAESFAAVVEEVLADDRGTPVTNLVDDADLDRWLVDAHGGYVHATGTCRMGTVVDEWGRVHGHEALFVCDASVFPSIPHVNPHLPTTLLAERLVARWCAADSSGSVTD